MSVFRRMRNRWNARRRELAMKQVEADLSGTGIAHADKDPSTDAFSGEHYASQRALGRFLNPKATTRTEWRGD